MKISWYTTASVRLESGEDSLLFDPFVPLTRPGLTGTYQRERNILITHGHLDHLSSVPEIVQAGRARVFCTKTPKESLLMQGVDAGRITVVSPGDRFGIGPFEISVLRGCHIRFDRLLVASTLLRCAVRPSGAKRILELNRLYPENGETVVYQIRAEDRTVLLLGSLGLDDDQDYPSPDVLVLPYQGRTDIRRAALAVVGRLRPRAVLLDHFDDSFPPISRRVSTAGVARAMARRFPGIAVIRPQPGEDGEI